VTLSDESPYAAAYEPDFDTDRSNLGLGDKNFDYFFQGVETFLRNSPGQDSVEVPNSEGIWMMQTRHAFPDIPPLYVYYRIEEEPARNVVFIGLSRAWAQSETV
jgi:hypothetical protein